MNNTLICALAIFVCVALVGCSRDTVPAPQQDEGEIPSPRSSTLTVDFYLDATLSMKGFTVPRDYNYYTQTLDILESSVVSGWPNGRARFFKFGTTTKELGNRDHLGARFPRFYTDREFFKRTYIERVIDSAKVDHLSVIVTDLFENDADISLLTARVKDRYLSQSLSVGILGIKSNFIDTVYDVGINQEKFRYGGVRPFYLVLLGHYSDVSNLYESLLLQGLSTFREHNFLVLSKYLAAKAISFEGCKTSTASNLVEFEGLLDPSKRNVRTKQLKIRGDPELASIEMALKSQLLGHTVDFDRTRLQHEVIPGVFKGDQFAAQPELTNALTISNVEMSDSSLRFRAELAQKRLPAKGVYCFKVILRPDARAFVLPEWISTWDMNEENISKWRAHPSDFDGSTTYNLKHLIQNILQTIVELNRPKVATLYFYVKKG